VRYRPVGYKHGKGDEHPAYVHLRRMQYVTYGTFLRFISWPLLDYYMSLKNVYTPAV